MITEIPTGSEFQATGLDQLYLAWQIAMQAVQGYEAVDGFVDKDERVSASIEYWAKSQPVLANAFGLIQQAMELALKGRIASVSPFLLIARDPKDWPKGVDTGGVPFSEFRTLDAADLIRVHNTFAAVPLDEHFRTFWDSVRRDRNKIMHSPSPRSFDPTTLVRTIMTAAQTLFADVRWPQHLINMEEEGIYAAYGLDESAQNTVMWQIDIAIRHLTPVENRRFFGFDTKRRSYLCPSCYDRADQDGGDLLPKLAQFPSKASGQRTLHCAVCDETVDIERVTCTNFSCEGDVIYGGTCLTCQWSQDDPHGFRSGLVDEGLGIEHRYNFVYGRVQTTTTDLQNLRDDEMAKEHARLAMLAVHLRSWEHVTIYHVNRTRSRGRLLGTWVRQADGPHWKPGIAPGAFDSRPTTL